MTASQKRGTIYIGVTNDLARCRASIADAARIALVGLVDSRKCPPPASTKPCALTLNCSTPTIWARPEVGADRAKPLRPVRPSLPATKVYAARR